MGVDFFGFTSLGPDDETEGDSPRNVYKTGRERDADSRLATLRANPTLVRTPRGNIVQWPDGQPIKPGFAVVSPDKFDERHDIGDGKTMSHRDQLHADMSSAAHAVRPGSWHAGPFVLIDGEWHRREFNDRDVNSGGRLRNEIADMPKQLKELFRGQR